MNDIKNANDVAKILGGKVVKGEFATDLWHKYIYYSKMYNHTDRRGIYSVYSRPSESKIKAYDNIVKMRAAVDGIPGVFIQCGSYCFSYAFIVPDISVLVYVTKSNTYVVDYAPQKE